VLQQYLWGSDIMTVPQATTEVITSGVKVASAITHLKNNRIEYLLLLGLLHILDFTSIVLDKAQGVCY